MKHKNKKGLLGTVVFFLVCVALGGLLGFSLTTSFGDTLTAWQAGLRIVEGVLLFLLAFFFQIIFHEAGHMLAAFMRGWSFISFMILGVVLTRRNGKFYLSRFAMPGVGGQCLMMPPAKGDTDFGIAFYNAGGVVMNCIVSIVALVLSLCFYDYFVWDTLVFLFSMCFTGFLFAFINGIPMVSGGVPNDGMNICELKKDAFATRVFLTTMRVMGKLQQGVNLDQISEEILDNGYLTSGVVIDYENPIHASAVNFDLSLAVARLDFDKAHVILDQLEPSFDSIIPIYQKEVTYERVFLYLVSPREGVDVGELIDSETLNYFEMQTAFRPTTLRVKYAFARLYENDEAKAEGIYTQFQKICKSYHIQGEVQTERRLVEYVRSLAPSES